MVQWTVTAINEAIEKDLKGFAAASEDNYTDQVMAVAMQIRNVREERPFILVSGPSGSGKTTTALRIETLLDDWDCETATVSLDNYFLPHDAGELPLDENGDPIPGLYQAGEIAGNAAVIGHTTLGGVSNTGCVVFGKRAGSCAAEYAANN